jgi:hypothetical protein
LSTQRSTLRVVVVLLAVSLLLGACNGNIEQRQFQVTFTPTPTSTVAPIPTATPVVIVPTVNVIIVTLPPPASLTPIPSATVPYDMLQYVGNWVVSLRVDVLGMPRFNDVRYSGVGQMSVTPQGRVSGRISFSTRAEQPLCSIAIRSSKPLEATMSGRLDLGEDGHVYAYITLRPDDPLQATEFEMLCEKPIYETIRTENILWPALTAARDLKLVFPVESGYTDSNVADLSGPTGGLLNGSVKIQTQLSR